MMKIHVVRAEELWQQAGAYYVRIQAMARQYHITLREEFDEHDTPKAKYIVLLDDEFPVATCRLYELSGETFSSVMLGRVVVLPEYRKKGLGGMAVTAFSTPSKIRFLPFFPLPMSSPISVPKTETVTEPTKTIPRVVRPP